MVSLKNKTTFLMVLTAVLWIAITIMGWTGYWYPAEFLGIALMVIYMLLGVGKNKEVDTNFLKYPIIPFAVLWVLNFLLTDYWVDKFAGTMPAFTIMGFHPSFGCTVFLYWIGGILTLTVGFVTRKDYWLTEEEWEQFLEKIDK